jgi:GTP:adenosylcobinamide-phosphate guanylyltransferase
MTTQRYPVVILAGGSTPEKILNIGETEKERAFISIGGRPMVSWVLDAFRGSDVCGDMLVVGNVNRLVSEIGLKPEQVTHDRGSMLENFIVGIEHFRSYPLVMQATCDIPLVKPSMLNELAEQVSKMDAEVFYPIVDVRLFDEKFPGGKRTTQKLKEGTFTGGNIFFLKPDAVLKNRQKVEAVIRDRKSPAKLVKLFGLPFIVKFALRQLDLNGLEKKATQILGAKMRGVITPYPEIGLDVDKPEDLTIVRSVLGHA